MEKVGKIKTIYRAFTQKSNIDPEILKRRREICASCPLNSLNKEKKGVFEEIRSTIVSKPFCTACGCQIEQKTATETECCGAVYLGQKPKWNRIKLETMNKTDINIINLSEEKANIDLALEGDHFVVECGEVDKYAPQSYSLILEGKEEEYKLFSAEPGCPFCTTIERSKPTDENGQEIKNQDKLDITFNLTAEAQGVGVSKQVYLAYNSSEGTKRTRIEFKFFAK